MQHLARSADRFLDADLALAIGVEGLCVDLVDRRAHHEEREEQREANQHLIGRRLLQSQRLAQQRQDDDDAGEAGHHEHERRQHRQQAHKDEDLQRERQRTAVARNRAHRLGQRAAIIDGRGRSGGLGQRGGR